MRRYLPVGLLVAAVLLVQALLLWIYYRPEPKLLWGDEEMYWQAAQALRAGADSRLDPLWPPLYPWFVALVSRIGGGSLLAVQLVQLLLLAVVAWIGRDLWRRLLGPGWGGDALALLVLAYPPLVAFAHYLWPEILHLALFFAALWIVAARRRSAGWSLLLGVVLGAALLTKNLLGPFLPVLLAPLALGRDPWPRRLLRTALAVSALAATVAPTALGNLERHGTTGLGGSARFNVWVGLNETSRRSFEERVVGREYGRYLQSAPDARTRNAILGERIAELVRERGLPRVLWDQLSRQYFRLLDKDSFLTLQLPGGAIAERGKGYRGTPPALAGAIRAVSYASWGLLLAGSVLGIAVCPPRGRRCLWVVLAFLGYNLALFLFLHVKSRYRVQFLPFLMVYGLLAVHAGLARLGPRWSAPCGERVSASALGVGIAGAALVLFLAFGGSLID